MNTLLCSLESLGEGVAKLQPEEELLDRWASRLLATAPARRMVLVTQPESFGHPALVPYLIERGQAVRHDDPHAALNAYLAASQVAERLRSRPHTPRQAPYRADLSAEALAHLANGQRALGRLFQAKQTLARAQRRTAGGSGNPLLEALLCAMTGALEVDFGHYRSAETNFRRAIDIYVDREEHEQAGLLMLLLGRCLFLAEEWISAHHIFQAGLVDVDLEKDPLLFLTVVVAEAKIHALLDQPEKGLALLTSDLEDYLEEDLGRVSFARLNLLRGELAAASGKPLIAIMKYKSALRLFAEIDLPVDGAIVCLEIAALYAEAGEGILVKREILRALEILRQAGADAYAQPTLRRLTTLAQRKVTSAAVVRYVSRRLRGEAEQQ